MRKGHGNIDPDKSAKLPFPRLCTVLPAMEAVEENKTYLESFKLKTLEGGPVEEPSPVVSRLEQ